MRVKATKHGFSGGRLQKAGTVFEHAGAFSASWMQKVEEPKPETAEAPKPSPETPEIVPTVKKKRGRKPRSQVSDSGASAPALSE